jgi:hypothetical protein
MNGSRFRRLKCSLVLGLSLLDTVTACSGNTVDAHFRTRYQQYFIKTCEQHFSGTVVQRYAAYYCTCSGTDMTRRLSALQILEDGFRVAPKEVSATANAVTRECSLEAVRERPRQLDRRRPVSGRPAPRASRMHQSGPNRVVLGSIGREPCIAKTLTISDYSVATRNGQDR